MAGNTDDARRALLEMIRRARNGEPQDLDDFSETALRGLAAYAVGTALAWMRSYHRLVAGFAHQGVTLPEMARIELDPRLDALADEGLTRWLDRQIAALSCDGPAGGTRTAPRALP